MWLSLVSHEAYPIVHALTLDLFLCLSHRCNFWVGIHDGRYCVVVDVTSLARNVLDAGHAILFSLSADLCQNNLQTCIAMDPLLQSTYLFCIHQLSCWYCTSSSCIDCTASSSRCANSELARPGRVHRAAVCASWTSNGMEARSPCGRAWAHQ